MMGEGSNTYLIVSLYFIRVFLMAQQVKNQPAMQETQETRV